MILIVMFFICNRSVFFSEFLMNMYEDEGEDEGRRWRNEKKKVGYWWYTLRYNKPSRSNSHFLIKKYWMVKIKKINKV